MNNANDKNKTTMNSEKVKLDAIRLNENNPRTIDTDAFNKLVDSVLIFPQMLELRPIVVDKEMVILGGNMRTQALRFIAGMSYSDVVTRMNANPDFYKLSQVEGDSAFLYWKQWLQAPDATILRAENLTEEQKKQFIIKDNVPFGKWDMEKLANEFDMSELERWGVDLMIDFSDPEPENELDKVNNDDFTHDEEEAAKEANITQPGDIWQLGMHRLICGDSTKVDDVKRLMRDEQADLWITDPPYNVAIENSKGMKIENDSMSSAKFGMFLTSAFQASNTVMKAGCPFYVWYASREHINFEQALNNVGMKVREQLIWNKNSFVLGRQDYQWKHDPCLYGWKEGAGHYFINSRSNASVIQDEDELNIDKMSKTEMRDLLHRIYDEKMATTVINENKPTADADHPTMKPVRLFAYQIANSSKKGDVVLDTFGGSGTTIIACEQLERRARLVELDPHYADVIVARYIKLVGSSDSVYLVHADGSKTPYREICSGTDGEAS